jgi:hypothetical protein
MARRQAGCRVTAEQAVAGGTPSGFSRIQIAWCAGCWPTSPRPPRIPPALLYHRGPPASGRAESPALPRPAAGDRQPAKMLIRPIRQHPHNGAGMRHRRIARPRAAMTAGRRSHSHHRRSNIRSPPRCWIRADACLPCTPSTWGNCPRLDDHPDIRRNQPDPAGCDGETAPEVIFIRRAEPPTSAFWS